jgi:hypothetical protein
MLQFFWNLFLVTALALMFFIPRVQAQAAWQCFDLGSSYFDEHNNTTEMSLGYPGGVGNRPSPGDFDVDGGERFDIEGISFAFVDSYLYVPAMASFRVMVYSVYSNEFNRWLSERGLFFGSNGSNYDYAVDTSTRELRVVDSWDYMPKGNGTYGSLTALQQDIGACRKGDIPPGSGKNGVLGSVWEEYYQCRRLEQNYLTPGNGSTLTEEYRISLADLPGQASYGTISFHTSVKCDNDVANKDFAFVPEPTAIILLGIGLLGIGANKRARSRSKVLNTHRQEK